MSSLRFQHFILTRFSYRPPNRNAPATAGADWILRHDPLNPVVLEYRFALFELACLPNILAQSAQNFDWIIIVDPKLPKEYRQRLEGMLSGRARTYLHEICADDNLSGLDWLSKYARAGTEFVLTTLLDDDDILPVTYVENLQTHVNALGQAAPAIMTLGTKKSYQWDIYVSRKHPLGTLSPWHRQRWFRSAGYSMLCEISKYELTCFALTHMAGDIWFESGTVEDLSHVMQKRWGKAWEPIAFHGILRVFQQRLTIHAGTGADDWKARSATELYYDLSEDDVFVVQTNHFLNDQGARLLEHKPGEIQVVDMQLFPDVMRINWSIFHKHQDLFKLSWKQYKKYLLEFKSIPKRLRLNVWRGFLQFVSSSSKLTWWFLRH